MAYERAVSSGDQTKLVVKRKTYKKKKINKKNVGFEALKEIRQLKNSMKKKIEIKIRDVSASALLAANPTVVQLSSIAQGDNIDNRQGNEITSKYVKLKYDVIVNTVAATNAVRVMVISGDFVNPTAPVSGNILEGASLLYLSAYQKNPAIPYRVLYDETVTVQTQGPQREDRALTIPLNDMHTVFDNTSGSDYAKNSVWLMIFADQITNAPTFSYYARYAYTDE